MDKEKITEIYKKYNIEINCTLIGLIFALCVIGLGFFNTIFIVFCVGLGFFVGVKTRQDKNFLINLLETIVKYFKR